MDGVPAACCLAPPPAPGRTAGERPAFEHLHALLANAEPPQIMSKPIARLVFATAAAMVCLVLLLPGFVVVGALYLFVWSVRFLGRLLEPRFVPWTELMTFDPALGWKPRPNLDAHYLAARDDVFHVVTDGDGWPGIRSLEESALVVVG